MKDLILTFEQINKLEKAVSNLKARSAWDKGIRYYAHFLCSRYRDYKYFNRDIVLNQRMLLNGASDWLHYSYGGCALVYDCEIAEILCNNTELKRTNHGERNPNRSETWLDVQARALHQSADLLILTAYKLFA